MYRIPRILSVVTIAFLLVGILPAVRAADRKRPNIVLIMADDK